MSPVSGFGLGLLGGGEAPATPWTDATAWGTVAGEWDFSDLSKITADVNHNVLSVTAMSGPAGPLTNGGNLSWSPKSGVRQSPTGLNVVDFPTYRGDERLYRVITTPFPEPVTIVTVIGLDGPTLVEVQICGDDPGFYITNYSALDQWVLMANQYLYSGKVPDTAWHVVAGIFNGVNSEFWMDGNKIKTGNSGGGTFRRAVVGNYGNGGYAINGAIGHQIWFQGVVADVAGMSKSLVKRWIG